MSKRFSSNATQMHSSTIYFNIWQLRLDFCFNIDTENEENNRLDRRKMNICNELNSISERLISILNSYRNTVKLIYFLQIHIQNSLWPSKLTLSPPAVHFCRLSRTFICCCICHAWICCRWSHRWCRCWTPFAPKIHRWRCNGRSKRSGPLWKH